MSISLHEYDVMKQFSSHNGNKENKHNTYAAAAQESQGNSVIGVVFSHTMPKTDFHYSHRFS